MKTSLINLLILWTIFIIASSCVAPAPQAFSYETKQVANVLNFKGTPNSPDYRESLAYSDQGAWFAYGFPSDSHYAGGFSGPFLMTQENGVWCSPVLSQLILKNKKTGEEFQWEDFRIKTYSYNSHLEQTYSGPLLNVNQILFFSSPSTAIQVSMITNNSEESLYLRPEWTGSLILKNIHFEEFDHITTIVSEESTSTGYIYYPAEDILHMKVNDSSLHVQLNTMTLRPGESRELICAHVFIETADHSRDEIGKMDDVVGNWQELLLARMAEKENELNILESRITHREDEGNQRFLLSKAIMTLQNNWRVPAGELKHSGLFPSYHYVWFHGFWAWDSWKHASALAFYNTLLAKEQIRAMLDFMNEDGFIADCVYRDTSIENHNYRNTKPPLLAWAVWNVFNQGHDTSFLEEVYPSIIKQHEWWYKNRDHDQDYICEYGSTDGTLIAAKWESGMDNAVRFDNSQILKNSENAYSLNQESVDLNAYLCAEKKFLVSMAKVLNKSQDVQRFGKEADFLAVNIQNQFFDPRSGWFYDTNLEGDQFIDVMGCEGWIPLWANVAFPEQANAVRNNIMNPLFFNTYMPLQTLSAAHPEFKPDGGYWRGPNWLDQAYFGIKGLRNYGFTEEADQLTHKLIYNAEGLLDEGPSIRENYHPLTGEGLESSNFSWSAAHYILLLLDK